MIAFWLKASALWCWGLYSTTVLLPLARIQIIFSHFSSLCQHLDSNLEPWDDEVRVLPLCYHHWPATIKATFDIFSLLVPAAPAGLKPLTLGWRGKCYTTVLLASPPDFFCHYFFFTIASGSRHDQNPLRCKILSHLKIFYSRLTPCSFLLVDC